MILKIIGVRREKHREHYISYRGPDVRNKKPTITIQFLQKFLLASVLPISALCAEQGERLEMWEEPSHQLVFVDGPARVLDVRIVPGVTSEFHKHRFATTYVIIQDALVAQQYWDGDWSASGPRDYRDPGVTMDRSDYVQGPSYHRVRNEDQSSFHVVAVVNERSIENAGDTPGRATNARAIDNAWFREHRVGIAPGANSDTLKFSNDVVLVQPVAGSSHVIENDIAHSFKGSPAAFSWHPAGSGFQIANRSDENLEFVLIEVKDSD
jgi:hypothetical protein